MEIWKAAKGYESYYDVSSNGRVRSYNYSAKRIGPPRLLKQRINAKGRPFLTLRRNKVTKTYKVHRLVAETFLPNPNNLPQVNHIDGVKTNNMLCNLEWCTAEFNHQHAFRLGLSRKGGGNATTKLTTVSVAEIRESYIPGSTIHGTRALAKRYGVSSSAIFAIIKFRTWQYV